MRHEQAKQEAVGRETDKEHFPSFTLVPADAEIHPVFLSLAFLSMFFYQRHKIEYDSPSSFNSRPSKNLSQNLVVLKEFIAKLVVPGR